MMMSWGMFGFELPNLVYDRLSRRTDWRHAETARVGARNARQFLGPGSDVITLSGCLVPQLVGDPAAVSTLRDMGDKGDALPLVDGLGVVHGNFYLSNLSEEQQVFFFDGVARKTDFTIELTRADDTDQGAPAQ